MVRKEISEMSTVEEQRQMGKKVRKEKTSRKTLGMWEAVSGREEVIQLIRESETGRIKELLPLRHERMAASPFSFFRGTALLQAHDLASTPGTPFCAQLCGDAHISNFGIFASPERRMVFDINDFDETLAAPFECDVKRLTASVEICGRDRGFSEAEREETVEQCARVYRETMRQFSETGNLDVWYAHLDIEDLVREREEQIDSRIRENVKETLEKARKKNSGRALHKLTEEVDGKLRIKNDPPLVVPLRELVGEEKKRYDFRHNLREAMAIYQQSLPLERRGILDQYEPLELARKVVGVGSVGTRSWILVMTGIGKEDPLVLQIKEAGPSVLEQYYRKSPFPESGRRVVEGQRGIQTAGDILLGWMSFCTKDGLRGDYYVRQLWDAKGSFELDTIRPDGLKKLGSMCAWILAHAHAKTGNRHMIAGYLGQGESFDRAMVRYARAYADQNEADYEVFRKHLALSEGGNL